MRLATSPDGRYGSVLIRQDARVYAALLDGAERSVHRLAPGRRAWVHVARGSVTVNGKALEAGDALGVSGAAEIALEQGRGAELLLFDLP